MRPRGRALVVALFVLSAAGCSDPEGNQRPGRFVITADTVDRAFVTPGTVFRSGPATADAIGRPVHAPAVRGAEGQVSIYDGFFVQAPCSLRPRASAERAGDTIVAYIVSEPDTATTSPCREAPKPLGYALLVGPFEAGRYAVRLVHEGDSARPTPLDTVYDDITVTPE